MKILVIPDVHLKPHMFDDAAALYRKLTAKEALLPPERQQPWGIVCLGDLADDWGQQGNLALYEETFDSAISMVAELKDQNVFFCIGNHDISYVWQRYESGYSTEAEYLVRQKMAQLNTAFSDPERFAFVHCIDNSVIFSHAGISMSFAMKHARYAGSVDQLICSINHRFTSAELWMNDSPLWVRMQDGRECPFRCGFMQVAGHTPVKAPLFDAENKLLSLDTFSTDPAGNPIGDCRFVVVDTADRSFRYADEIA